MGSRKFEVGDRVRVSRSVFNPLKHYAIGVETTVLSVMQPIPGGKWPMTELAYEVDIPSRLHDVQTWPRLWFEASELVPLYDGNELAAWSDCIWQPNKITA